MSKEVFGFSSTDWKPVMNFAYSYTYLNLVEDIFWMLILTLFANFVSKSKKT